LIRQVATESESFPSQDTYGAGKRLNRLAQLLATAAMSGDEALLDALKKKLKTEIDSWSVAEEELAETGSSSTKSAGER
jgi:hypothetical protein